jgi:hypothetical protein
VGEVARGESTGVQTSGPSSAESEESQSSESLSSAEDSRSRKSCTAFKSRSSNVVPAFEDAAFEVEASEAGQEAKARAGGDAKWIGLRAKKSSVLERVLVVVAMT